VPGFDPGLYVIPSRIWICRSLGRAPLYRAPGGGIWFSFVPLFYVVGPRLYDYRPPTKLYISRAHNAQFLFPSSYLDFRQLSTIIAGLSLYVMLKPLQSKYHRYCLGRHSNILNRRRTNRIDYASTYQLTDLWTAKIGLSTRTNQEPNRKNRSIVPRMARSIDINNPTGPSNPPTPRKDKGKKKRLVRFSNIIEPLNNAAETPLS
jgi:hypothetical protein